MPSGPGPTFLFFVVSDLSKSFARRRAAGILSSLTRLRRVTPGDDLEGAWAFPKAHEYLFATNSALAAGLSARDTTTSIRPVHPEPAKPEAPKRSPECRLIFDARPVSAFAMNADFHKSRFQVVLCTWPRSSTPLAESLPDRFWRCVKWERSSQTGSPA